MALHRAEPTTADAHLRLEPPICKHCGGDITRVPGGQGPTWVHADGFVVGPGPATG